MHIERGPWALAPVALAVAAVILVLASSVAQAHDSDSHPDDHIRGPGAGNWNGYRIYLSPAHHWGGEKQGCGDYLEEENMHLVAHRAGFSDPAGLLARGYKVRIGHGDPDDNTERSNAWHSHRHIPLHSNASGNSPCAGTEGGTVVFHYPGSSVGADLAARLKNKVGVEPVSGSPFSPGTRYERVAAHDGLWELNRTSMPAAYLEAEFHDWRPGTNWLSDSSSWAWRIAWAVDAHLGYPGPCGQCCTGPMAGRLGCPV